jgi:hypothetical protein
MAERILINCREDELTRERAGFYSALRRRVDVLVAPVRRLDASVIELAGGASIPVSHVSSLWHLDPPTTTIPEGLPATTLLTVWVHMDGATAIPWRSLWSQLFDVACVCGTEGSGFDGAGIYRVVAQPYAARREWFSSEMTKRDLDLAWAGSTRGSIYSRRRWILPRMAARYRMNDWREQIPEAAVLPLYRRAKIVVNIQRDDCPELYNLRCFEAFAAGALVLIETPTALEGAGFREGIHYAGYRSETDLFEKIDFFLANEGGRTAIAAAGRDLVQRRHTYDHRVAELLSILGEVQKTKSRYRQPLSRARGNYLYCHYYSKRLDVHALSAHLKPLFHSASPLTVPAIAHCSRALWHRWWNARAASI